ncbi:major facilitator superfamily domain, general substrate transporter [Aspergillus udagawae]|uniref:Major facilitator superfamily domain, general substrate transporter n=1 Tax=Aspergillus udagawae TaxID=91492 RepID=A0ABQ1B3Q9_9EURO|nr:major facilitator superfamily domain, general substrate transporter [Aspergillus udagawae]GFF93139.1 major facilitator superfamily domain, general substrate transporter [Aspergillus udagawae]
MDERTPLLQNQSHRLSHNRLLIIFPALALIQFTSFLDQTAIATSLPAIASALNTGASISLVGVSFLVTSTSIQLINGRLSDIFGRKLCLAVALSIMGLGNLLSGFCTTPARLFASRAFTGFGAGAINALVQIGIADITTLEQRGKYFGMVGIAVAMGNGLGPAIGGFLTQAAGWQWSFWFVCPLTAIAIVYLLLVWPESPPTLSKQGTWDKLKLVDWVGAGTSLVAIACFLIPVSQGPSALSWGSPVLVSMLLGSGVLFSIFCLVEFRLAKLPMLPLHLFQYGQSTNILIFSNISIGWIFWGNLFITPLYLQNIRGLNPGQAGLFILPMVIAHGLTSALSGIIISACGHYKHVIVAGAFCWAIAAIAKLHFHELTPTWIFMTVCIFDGIGVGCALQPVLVGLFAGSHTKDRAVLTGLRNFLRDLGGAVGTAVSGAILSNVLFSELRNKFDLDLIAQLTSSAFELRYLNLSDEERQLVSNAYMNGIHLVFLSYTVLIGLHLFACLSIEDYGLSQRKQQENGEEAIRENGESEQ